MKRGNDYYSVDLDGGSIIKNFEMIGEISVGNVPNFESDWKAIEETLYLNAMPGMAQSIRDGMNTPTSDLDDKLDW